MFLIISAEVFIPYYTGQAIANIVLVEAHDKLMRSILYVLGLSLVR
jgi:hypothetical protein